jgi:DNA-binding MarR family transcriptional regulator
MCAFGLLLRAHAAMTRYVDARLIARHGLTTNDVEVLMHLANAEGGRLRRSDLAERATLTPSGITRLLQGLEGAGLVARSGCETDGRVSYAELTDAGRAAMARAKALAAEHVDELFGDRFTPDEVEQLTELLGRLPGARGDGDGCPGRREPRRPPLPRAGSG